MSDLRALTEEREILKPFGELDVLLFYSIVSPELKAFLGDREVASKVWLKQRSLLNRGSQLPPLHADEIATKVTPDLLKLRAKMGLADVRDNLNAVEQKIWRYFPPRKLCDYFYATNHEGRAGDIDRIFYDIDRPKDVPHEKAKEVTRLFLEGILGDDEFRQYVTDRPLVAWTGSSFHIYLFLKQKQKQGFYAENIHYSDTTPETGFTAKCLQTVKRKTQIPIIGGHEKKPGFITIDPSQTPSGKLARSPLGSLHMSDYQTVDGVSIPIEIGRLQDQGLAETLREYTPKRLLNEMSEFSMIISSGALG